MYHTLGVHLVEGNEELAHKVTHVSLGELLQQLFRWVMPEVRTRVKRDLQTDLLRSKRDLLPSYLRYVRTRAA
jgi:hypothetical protein